MSGKVANVQRKPSESWRTVVQYHFKNDKKVWLLGNKMQRNKGVAQGFCTALCIQYVVFTDEMQCTSAIQRDGKYTLLLKGEKAVM